jgi:hypothetical protein
MFGYVNVLATQIDSSTNPHKSERQDFQFMPVTSSRVLDVFHRRQQGATCS